MKWKDKENRFHKQTKQAGTTALQYEVDLKVINPSLVNEKASKQDSL